MKYKLKHIIYYLCILICCIFLCSSLFLQITYYKFSSENVKNTINLIASPQYEGRLTGTSGNLNVANMIESIFKNNKLSPYNNNYQETFNVLTPIITDSQPNLSIENKNGSVLTYKYAIDYKEDMLNFRTTNVTFTENDDITICLDSIIIDQKNHKYLFHIKSNNDFKFRSSFNSNSIYDFVINITTDVYNNILNSLRDGSKIKVNLPYSIEKKSTSNVIGVIKGSSSSLPPLILTSHYDHLGKDYLGTCYNGALDNASGTSFLLELSKSLSSLIKPKRDIIFIALSGEEFGLLGSKDFVSRHFYEIKDCNVINFDMIGAANTPVTFMNGSDSANNNNQKNFLNTFTAICDKENIKYTIEFRNSSDHASFCNAKIPAITLCNSDTSKIHTPNDIIDYIDEDSINNVYNIIQPEIYNLAYDKNLLILYNQKITLLAFFIFIILLLYPYCKKRIVNLK